MLVKKYLAGEITAAEACKFVRINDASFRSWIRIYNQEGSLGLLNDGVNRKYSSELKSNAVESYLSGEGSQSEICKRYKIRSKRQLRDWIESGHNYGEIAEKYNVGYQQVYTWVKKYTDKGAPGLHDRRGQRKKNQAPRTPEEEAQIRIAKLEHENYLLRMERDLLKKVEELERRDAFRK